MSIRIDDATAPPSRAVLMSCAEATLRSMVDAGAKKLFCIPGRGVYPLLNELPKVPELEFVTSLHEFPLAAMADGYARAHGTAAFMNLYMSTGTLNASSAIFLAQRDRIPLVVTATQAESFAVGADHRAEISDILAAMRPITKWAWMPPTPDRVPEALRRAHAIATTPPMGPTFVAIPVDYWNSEVSYTASVPAARLATSLDPSSDAITTAAAAIVEADFPCFVIGREAVAADADMTLLGIACRLGCAVIAEPEPPALPAPTRHPLFAGSVPEASALLEEADVVIHAAVNTYESFHGKILDSGRPKQHVWLGTADRELDKVVRANVLVEGPIRAIAAALSEALDERPADVGGSSEREARVLAMIAAERETVEAACLEAWDAHPMAVARAMAEIRKLMPPETILVDHSTTAMRLLRESFPVPRGSQYVSASGSCQGWGIGAAVGVQLAHMNPVRPVIAVVGDGGLMFGVQALWSAARHNVPLLAVVLNNGGWSSMRTSLIRNAPALLEAGTEMHFGFEADYARLAQSLGVAGETVSTPEEIRRALDERLPLTAPLLLDVRVRREPKTSPSPFVGY